MTILSELARLYDRLAADGRAPRPGYSAERISFAIEIDADGNLVALRDKRSLAGKKPASVMMSVPSAVKRTVGIAPNRLWDKSAYVLGVIGLEQADKSVVPGQGRRTVEEHAAFVAAHQALLADATDAGLVALRRFLESWTPDQFAERGLDVAALDQNLVFEFAEGGRRGFVHDRPAAAALLTRGAGEAGALCLVSGVTGPVARLHPSIRGVQGAQSSGASLVSFNAEAYTSFGKEQGDNAPVSEAAAFAYGTALNALLERKPSRAQERHLRIGDTTVVFWADAAGAGAAEATEDFMSAALSPDEAAEVDRLQATLADVAAGRATDDPRFDPATRVFLLGLAPNAARLSVRFWQPGTFGDFARNVQRFWSDLAIEPAPWKGPPAAWALLYEIAAQRDAKNIPPLLGGQLMRAVLTGQPLPRSLLTAVIARIRADGDVNGRRAAICRAVINRRSTKEEIPVSLDPDSPNIAYNLGRLFAAYAYAEQSYADRGATIRDKYMGSASATPARVFPLLMRGYEHNRSALLKAGGKQAGSSINADKAVAAIIERLSGAEDLPLALDLEEQGKFFVGFYHQNRALFTKADKSADAATGDQE